MRSPFTACLGSPPRAPPQTGLIPLRSSLIIPFGRIWARTARILHRWKHSSLSLWGQVLKGCWVTRRRIFDRRGRLDLCLLKQTTYFSSPEGKKRFFCEKICLAPEGQSKSISHLLSAGRQHFVKFSFLEKGGTPTTREVTMQNRKKEMCMHA